ncbi:MAG: hypothetical protein DMG65_11325 [Candidatus Angelobacter sp. Gp1-AA117]|nr:MAG: hypothetical protein DMG65_11325 [Candidatus Angelobacter sp. Gp1-AA117]
MPPKADSTTDKLIRRAIAEKRLVRFIYQDKERVAEPHDYGQMKGTDRLFCYQVRGQSTGRLPNWRLVDISGISGLEVLEETFPGSRGADYDQHLNWNKIYARVA